MAQVLEDGLTFYTKTGGLDVRFNARQGAFDRIIASRIHGSGSRRCFFLQPSVSDSSSEGLLKS